jgi:hypothetical protein
MNGKIDKNLIILGICSIACIDFLIVLLFLNPNEIGALIGTTIGTDILAAIWIIGIINMNRVNERPDSPAQEEGA